MIGACPQCTWTGNISGHRGSRLADVACPQCPGDVRLQGVHAGKKRVRYQCPVTGAIVLAGISGMHLDGPYRVQWVEPEHRRSWLAEQHARWQACDGMVLGPDTVVADALFRTASCADPGQVIKLVRCDDADPGWWVTNQPIKISKCRACGATVAPGTAPVDREWTPARELAPTNKLRPRPMGPHPAGSIACTACLPAEMEREPA